MQLSKQGTSSIFMNKTLKYHPILKRQRIIHSKFCGHPYKNKRKASKKRVSFRVCAVKVGKQTLRENPVKNAMAQDNIITNSSKN